jgi:hypothetical protein
MAVSPVKTSSARGDRLLPCQGKHEMAHFGLSVVNKNMLLEVSQAYWNIKTQIIFIMHCKTQRAITDDMIKTTVSLCILQYIQICIQINVSSNTFFGAKKRKSLQSVTSNS